MRRDRAPVGTAAVAAAWVVLLLALASPALAQLPDTTINSAPPAFTNSPNASFTFSGSPPGTSFQCKLDSGAFVACASPHNLSGMTEGSHTFQVRAAPAGAPPDPTPASHTWTVDFTAPDTVLSGAPPAFTSSTTATFEFSATESGAMLECSLNGAPFGACTSPLSYMGLGDGTRNFTVRAVDQAGNVDFTPPSHTWTVDATPPDTSFSSLPPNPSNDHTPEFGLAASESGATFECSLDGAPFAACATPFAPPNIAGGDHALAVRAVDMAGNADPTPAQHAFALDFTLPAKPTRLYIGPASSRGRAPPTLAGGRTLPVTSRFQLATNRLKVTWTGPADAVAHKIFYERIPTGGLGGNQKTWENSTAAKSKSFTGLTGNTYCFVAVAIDAAGNQSFGGAKSCTALPHRASSLKLGSGWAKHTGSGYYRTQYVRWDGPGTGYLRLHFGTDGKQVRLRRFVLVATKCSSCGKVKVYLTEGSGFGVLNEASRIATVDLKSANTQKRRQITLKTFSPAALEENEHVLWIQRVAGNPRIEGVGVSSE